MYIGALYLEEKLSTPDDIFENNGAKAMYFYMLRERRSIANALKEAMQANLTCQKITSRRLITHSALHHPMPEISR